MLLKEDRDKAKNMDSLGARREFYKDNSQGYLKAPNALNRKNI